MAMTLYHGEPNGPSLSVLAALFETGLEARLVHIDLLGGERYIPDVRRSREVEMSIEGEGPLLVSDGEAMAESVFIGCYLDEVAGGGRLVPQDAYARWRMMSWCRWLTERTSPACALLGTRAYATPRLATIAEADFERITGAIASADLRERWRDCRAGVFSADQLADSRAKIDQAILRIEGQLVDGDWLMGDFTLADLETYAWLAGAIDLADVELQRSPRAAAWVDRVRARPSVQRALATATQPDPRHAWAPGPEINRWG